MNKNKTWGEFLKTPDGSTRGLVRNYILSFATGLMWYTQFFFYGSGHLKIT